MTRWTHPSVVNDPELIYLVRKTEKRWGTHVRRSGKTQAIILMALGNAIRHPHQEILICDPDADINPRGIGELIIDRVRKACELLDLKGITASYDRERKAVVIRNEFQVDIGDE